MSINPTWNEPESMSISKEEIDIAAVLREALKDFDNGVPIGTFPVVRHMAERLIAAGYQKADTSLPPYLNRLTHELKDFRESLGRIIEGTRLLKLTDEKAGQIERIMEHAKNRQEGR